FGRKTLPWESGEKDLPNWLALLRSVAVKGFDACRDVAITVVCIVHLLHRLDVLGRFAHPLIKEPKMVDDFFFSRVHRPAFALGLDELFGREVEHAQFAVTTA